MLSFIILSGKPAVAEDTNFKALGLRVGISNFGERDFKTFEGFVIFGLPWSRQPFSDWVISPRWDLAGGIIRQDEDSELLVTFGPSIALSKTGWPVTVDGGVGLAFLSDDKIGDQDFGAPLQFTAHGGISFKIGSNTTLGYRFHHMSDMGFFDGDGLNRHLIELSLQF